MQEYPIKRGFTKGFEIRMVEGLKDCFDVAPQESGGTYTLSYGALKRLEVCLGPKGKTIVVGTESDTSVEDDEIILDTNRRFRRYLEYVTGYNSKERAKKAKKMVE
ncbi:MAG: hypothetical protein APR53_06865 [Methanoculleus sp. SDB]|nr:MAG: hypothetical protein APR53_06865 [Methanoculleus sp. SDB]